MGPGALLGAAWAASAVLAQTPYDVSVSSLAPPPAEARVEPAPAVSAEKQRTLLELARRRLIDPGARDWEVEDFAMLQRLREAESLGAFDLLREKAGTLRGFAVDFKGEGGRRRLLLTKAGFQRYVFLKSQSARKYFEGKGTDAKFVFQVRDLEGRRVFDGMGVLTAEGDTLYNRILRDLPTQWRQPNGQVVGNRRPPRP